MLGKSEKIGKLQQASERQKDEFSARSFEPIGRLGIRARPDLTDSGARSFRSVPIECTPRPFVKRHMLDCLCRRAQCNLHHVEGRHCGSCPRDEDPNHSVLSVLTIPTEPRLRMRCGTHQGLGMMPVPFVRDATRRASPRR